LAVPDKFDGLRVVLVRPRNPLNIGAVARAMSNFEFSHLRVVNPYQAAFREARSAVGAAEVLARAEEYKSVGDAVADCALVVGTTSVGQRDLQQPLKQLESGAALIRKRLASSRVALLFGSEKIGLKNEDFSHCHWLMRIPTAEQHRSLNLGQAVAISLYELARCGGPANDAKIASELQNRKAAAADLERLTTALLDSLQASGYLKSRSSLNEEKIRRLVRRLNLSPEDTESLVGMLRQILWKMTQGAGSKGPSS
jgi:TrmH family RNA methyltransferase